MELENRDFVGDFLGFSYNDTHSSTLGLVRVSAGNRYSKNLFPAFANKTVQPEGKDGFYYFGAYYTNNQFQVETAFDNLSEVQFQKLSTAFSCKQFKELWFDETPYKAFWAKLAEAPQIKYMCFTGDNGQRVYKGDVTFKFETLESWAHNRVCSAEDRVMVIKKVQDNSVQENTIAPQIYWVEDGYKFEYEKGTLDESFNWPDWEYEISLVNLNDIKTATLTAYVQPPSNYFKEGIREFYDFDYDNNDSHFTFQGKAYQDLNSDEKVLFPLKEDSQLYGNFLVEIDDIEDFFGYDNADDFISFIKTEGIIMLIEQGKNKKIIKYTDAAYSEGYYSGFIRLYGYYLDDSFELDTDTGAKIKIYFPINYYSCEQQVKEGDYLLSFDISRDINEDDMFYKIQIDDDNSETPKYFILKIKDKFFKADEVDEGEFSYKLYIDSKKQICYIIKTKNDIADNKKYISNIELVEEHIFKLPQTPYLISVKSGTDKDNIDTTINYEFKPYYYFY